MTVAVTPANDEAERVMERSAPVRLDLVDLDQHISTPITESPEGMRETLEQFRERP